MIPTQKWPEAITTEKQRGTFLKHTTCAGQLGRNNYIKEGKKTDHQQMLHIDSRS
jgi:hypothetical protein